MFLKTLPAEKNGNQMMYYAKSKRTHIGYKINENGRRVKTYRIRAEVIKYLGYIHEFKDQYDDPIEHFKAEAKRITAEENKKKEKIQTTIKIDLNERFAVNTSFDYYLGNLPILALLNQIGIIRFMNNKRRDSKAKFNHTHILQLMIYNRIIRPSSIMQAYSTKDKYFDNFNFSLDDMYRALGLFLESKDRLIQTIHKNIVKHYNRDTSLLFYDVTNYYFEIDNEDDFRRKGVSKEHRPNPIVQLGLFMDDMGIPVTFDLFNGNTNDSLTFPSMVDKTEFDLKLQNLVYIADKGMMVGKNIKKLILNHCGYVMSASIRKSDKAFKQYVLDQDGYQSLSDSTDSGFKYKSRYYPRDIWVENANGTNSKVSVNERQVIFYSDKYARKAKKDREKTILKAKKLLKMNSNRVLDVGARKYIKQEFINKETNSLIEGNWDNKLIFDEEKLREEEKYDGYYAIFSNVEGLKDGEKPFTGKAKWMKDGFLKLNKTVSDLDIIQMYRGLWEIEETFKISKSEFKARPVYLSLKEHIEAHFLICFLSLVIIRLMQRHCNFTPVAKITKSLRAFNCLYLEDNNYKLTSFIEPLDLIAKSMGFELDYVYRSRQNIKSLYGQARKL